MSTRAQIVVRDAFNTELWFYRHSDGYPSGVMPLLETFLGWVKEGKLRADAMQSAGWLILQGAHELRGGIGNDMLPPGEDRGDRPTGLGWKVGTIEPCAPALHGDTEYLYTVDLQMLTISVKEC
jgi:hypothetical protein